MDRAHKKKKKKWKRILVNDQRGRLRGMCPLKIEEIFENVPFKWSDFELCFEINFAILIENGCSR